MREDMVHTLRQTMTSVLAQKDSQQTQLPSSLTRNMFPVLAVLGIAEKPRPSVMVAIRLPMSARPARMKVKKEREDYWAEYGRGMLPLDALVCILVKSSSDSQAAKVVFATVSRRDTTELAEEAPIIGLTFNRSQEVVEILQTLGQGRLKDMTLVQVTS